MARPKCVSKQLIEKIRFLYSEGGLTQQQIAKQFGLSQSTICKIINNYIHKYCDVVLSGQADVKVGYKYGN